MLWQVFDSVDPFDLCATLLEYTPMRCGVTKSLLDWLKSYLSNRTQMAIIGRSLSPCLSFTSSTVRLFSGRSERRCVAGKQQLQLQAVVGRILPQRGTRDSGGLSTRRSGNLRKWRGGLANFIIIGPDGPGGIRSICLILVSACMA